MLGVPQAPAATLAILALAGAVLAVVAWTRLGRRPQARLEERLVALAVATAIACLPYVGWRIVEDVRYTRSLDPYERAAAGPIQSFLPGYLAAGARSVVPPQATYATVVGRSVSNATARAAFGPLVLTTLFPRRSVPVPEAEWIVAWGIAPDRVARVDHVVVVRRRLGSLPPVYVARVER